MRKYFLMTAAVAGTVMALATPTASSAATVTSIVLYTGGGNPTPVGPAVLNPSGVTVFTAPKTITTTNDGTLVEDTSLTATGVTDGGEWWYTPSYVELHAFYWVQPDGTKLLAQNLTMAVANNGEWENLGNGVYTPKCLTWLPYGTMDSQYIRLTSNDTWVKTTNDELGEYC
jgi:hypothetical protein